MHRQAGLHQGALGGMLHPPPEAQGIQVRIVEQVVQRVDRRERDVGGLQQVQPLPGGPGRQDGVQEGIQLGEMPAARRLGAVARIGGHRRFAGQFEEPLPLAVGVGHHANVAIERAKRPPELVEQPRIAGAAFGWHEGLAGQVLHRQERHHAFEHRHLDRLPDATLFPRIEGRGDRIGDIQRDDLVGHHRLDVLRRAGAGVALQPGHAAGRLDGVVHRRAAGVRAALGIPVAGAVDQAGQARGQGVCIETETAQRGCAHVRDEHVRAFKQREQPFSTELGLRVEHHAALVAVQVQVRMAHARVALRGDMAEHIALGRLDLDHVGAEIAQHLCGHRTHAHGRQVDDAHARQRTTRHGHSPVITALLV